MLLLLTYDKNLKFSNPHENGSKIVPLGLLRKTPLEKAGVFFVYNVLYYGRICSLHSLFRKI